MNGYPRLSFLSGCLLLFLIFISCSHKKTQVTKSYYYWRTKGLLSASEADFLKQHAISKVYMKLMDVDWSDVYGAYPVTSTAMEALHFQLNDGYTDRITVVPVIFITNKTFVRIDSADIPLLAKRIVRRCLPAYDSIDREYENSELNSAGSPGYLPQEIQFDCDWTVSTAKKYFYFLQKVDSLLADQTIKLSATIRLHQFKYIEKTGIPHVDRGMLMVYNISDLTKYEISNSIFDLDKARAYFTSGKKYPLPLDIALPAYSWCIIFRNKEFYQIENQVSESDLKKCSFLKPVTDHLYQVMQDTVFRDLFLRPGDEIRVETIDKKTLNEAAQLAARAVNTDSLSVALFELSDSEIKNYDYGTIESAYSSYR